MLISEEKNVTTVTASGINRIELDTRIHLFLMPQETDRIFKALQGFCEDLKLESNEFNQLTLTEELDLADLTILYIKDATWGSDKMKQLRSEPKHFLKPILAVYEQAPDNFTELVDLNLTWPVLKPTLLVYRIN